MRPCAATSMGLLVIQTADDTFHAGRVGIGTVSGTLACFDDMPATAL